MREVVDDSDSTMADLADVLKLDPAISARLLRIVNSPLYGFPKQIDTVTRAVNLIGMQAVAALVTATTVGLTFPGMTIRLMDVPMFWRKSVLCALLAGKIAKSCGINDSEGLFIEGLLRDIGHLVLYLTVPQEARSTFVKAGTLNKSLAEVERSTIGCNFAEVGAELIRSWGMSVQIEQAVRHQLNPSDAGEFALHASIVHLAGGGVDPEVLDPNRRHDALPFEPNVITATLFAQVDLPVLLTEARHQLQDTLALIHPSTMAT
ncbi:MAG: hypothetical protein NTAFB01_09530 [Nitrospira sp.]